MGKGVTPPVCRLCGKPHWNTDPHVWGKETSPAGKAKRARVTKPATPSRDTKPVRVDTSRDTPVPGTPSRDTSLAACPRCREYELELSKMRVELAVLAEKLGKRKASDAARQRASRAARRRGA